MHRPHARRPRGADDVRREARGVRIGGSPQPPPSANGIRASRCRRDLGSCGNLFRDRSGVRAARALPSGARARAGLHAGGRTRPPRRAPDARSRSRARAWSAWRRRYATSSARRSAEVQEPFGSEQKGSSAMPHKRNPILSEQLCGLARVLRGNAQAALEDVALWHERDISHSSVERVILPDSTILLDYMQHRAAALVEGMVSTRSGCARTSSSPTARSSPRRCCSPSCAPAWAATRRIASSSAPPSSAWDERTPLRELILAEEPGDRGRAARHAGERLRARRDPRLHVLHATRERDRRATRSSRLARVSDAHTMSTATLDLPLMASGKVREMYALPDAAEPRVLMVASDRISTYDVVHPTPIPDKGKVLTGLSVFWFERTAAHRREPPRLGDRGGAGGGARAGARRTAAADAARGVRRARLPHGFGLEGLHRERFGLGRCAAAEACASPSACGSRSSRPRRRRRRDTTRRSASSRRRSSSATKSLMRARRGDLAGALLVRGGARARERRDPRGHEVRARVSTSAASSCWVTRC